MDPGSAKLDMVNTVDAHANTPQKRKRCPDEASTEPWSVAKSDMTVTSDMGRWEKADLDDSQNEELLNWRTCWMRRTVAGQHQHQPQVHHHGSPLSRRTRIARSLPICPSQPIPQKQFPSTAQKPQHPGMRCWTTWGRSWWQRSKA